MSRYYSDPSREEEPYALTDVEVWQDDAYRCTECDSVFPGEVRHNGDGCPDCGSEDNDAWEPEVRGAYWYAFGFPGCLNDSEPSGPFETEEAAVKAAQEMGEGE